MRLFVAVIPPPAALSGLATAVAGLRELPDADRLRWTQPESWHFTVAFYGEVAEELLPELTERLTRAAHRHRPYELRLVDGGRFVHRTLWVGADGELPAMARLAATAAAAGRRTGIPVDERRSYTPHLTLARNTKGADLRPFAAGLAGFAGTPWTVEELVLLRSHPPEPGVEGAQPRYEPLTSRPLG